MVGPMQKQLFRSVAPLLIALAFAACQSTTSSSAKVENITPKEAYGELTNSFGVLVDVRESDELSETGLADGAVWIPTSKIKEGASEWTDFLKKTPKEKKLMFYCAAGVRAGRAASDASGHGFKAYNVGGFRDWKSAGLPIKKWEQK